MTKRRSPGFYRFIGLVGTSRLVTRLHPIAYRATGGRWVVGRTLGMLNIVVETVGRRSRVVREIPLFAAEDGERLVVLGSNMGRDAEPAWAGNLRSTPRVRVRVGRDLRHMRAREVDGDERARLWALAARAYPGYDDYAAWTSRRIPVFVLEPVSASDAA